MRKHLIAGAAILALFVNSPQISAADDDVVIFGGEFDDEDTPRKVERPAPIREIPPPVERPVEQPVDKPKVEPVAEPEPVKQPADEPKVEPVDKPKIEPVNEPETVDEADDDLGDVLIFDDISHVEFEPVEEPTPVDEPKIEPVDKPKVEPVDKPKIEPVAEPEAVNEPEAVDEPFKDKLSKPVSEPVKNRAPRNERNQRTQRPQVEEPSNQKLKQLKKRFVKLAVDETYVYYLDRTSVQWRKMPYSSSEYIADFWVRMIAREPQGDDDSYAADDDSLEILSAREKGYRYRPEDEEVLRRQSYVLEHYYLRPKTKQIQFLCELEVFGRPQNTINEREYDYRNWEDLVPGSVESVIYTSVVKLIDTGKADAKGHMTFSDMLDEYLRISL